MCVCKSNDKKLIKDYEIGDILIFCSVCGLYKHLPYKQSPSSGNVIVSKIINNNTIEVRL